MDHRIRSVSSAVFSPWYEFSSRTVYRCLRQIRLHARKLVRCVQLTATDYRLRLACSREHALWTPQMWACVMFYKESRFSIKSDSRRTFISKALGTTKRTSLNDTVSVAKDCLLEGGCILGSRTDLYVQIGTMTGQICRDVLLEQHVLSFRGSMGTECVFTRQTS
ncbi:transposable element Tcb1 transposase [Trichonephila clavipes]|nr:transposable element Tcb1 transposase [Trichonephila clavipes]